MPTAREDVLSWRGQDMVDNDGDKIGKIEEIYLDQETNEPEWAVVTTGLFGTKQTFVPIGGASATGDAVRVPFEKSQVKDAPHVDPDGSLSPEEERQLYQHYGRDWGDSWDTGQTTDRGDLDVDTTGRLDRDAGETTDRREYSETTGRSDREAGGPGRDTSGPNTDDAMTLSEEELRVGTTEREAGRVRLRKYVVEDEVTETVPVRREEVRIEREPITDANRDAALDGPAISEEEHEVVLHEEEVVADKRAVPKERVRLEKDVETEEKTVSETVRSERVDVDDSRR
jgi:uncharacterized protein (TIGR02271 family)